MNGNTSGMRRRTLAMAGIAGAAAVPLLAACGSDDGESGDSGPVKLKLWSDKAGMEEAVAAFNEAHDVDDIQIEYVEVPADDMVNQVNQAVEAGDPDGSPDLFHAGNRKGGELLAQQQILDIGSMLEPHAELLDPSAITAMSIGDIVYAVPNMRNANFVMVWQPAFEEAGLAVPTSWEEVIETGKELKKDGRYIFNFAGEDPSTWMYMAWQAGARWYQVEGDAWKISIDSEESAYTADIIQQLFDNDLVEKISYADYAAMMQEYDQGNIVLRQTSTWQLAGHQANMDATLGQWALAPNLGVMGGEPISAADTEGLMVGALSEHAERAVEAAVWLNTDEKSVTIMASPVDGSGWYPAVADTEPYLEAVVPADLLGENAADAVEVILGAGTFADDWIYGPNSTSMYEELADQWGKAMAGELKFADIAPHMQEWTVNDLKERGIDVVE
ncbi:ABC transporter substrate-binding protein [Glycomyces buryatensis]|uniref:Extracellular solute-binding protein n=1 Tax=Glycomyces buryatensis TaxID=2570927 RepID=A0A4S8QJ60_9ACTN|nr:extracellular solute-binding protein [Glycomyces buryatensis]THV43045.1 extracellular solute-binding protein [Glycomyces buryatensis]